LTGAIIGKCQLVDCVSANDLHAVKAALFDRTSRRPEPSPVADHLQPLVDLAVAEDWTAASFNRHGLGPFCFLLTDPEQLPEPIPAKGRLNVWTFSITIK